MAKVRYIVRNVPEAVGFYKQFFGFSVVEEYGEAMAIVQLDDLQLWLAGPLSSAGRKTESGEVPISGGWNRIVISTDNLVDLVDRLLLGNLQIKHDIVHGPGGSQSLCADPSGNLIELFQSR